MLITPSMGGHEADNVHSKRRHIVHNPDIAAREFNASRRKDLDSFYNGGSQDGHQQQLLRQGEHPRGSYDEVTGLQVGGRRSKERESKKWHLTDEEFMEQKRAEYARFVRNRPDADRTPQREPPANAAAESTCGISLPDIGEDNGVMRRREELNRQRREDMRNHLASDRERGHFRLRNRTPAAGDDSVTGSPERPAERQNARLSGRRRQPQQQQQQQRPAGAGGEIAGDQTYFEETPLLSVDRFAAAKEAELNRRKAEQQQYFREVMAAKHGQPRTTTEEYQARVANPSDNPNGSAGTTRMPIWLGGATVADDDRKRRDAQYAVELGSQLNSRARHRADEMLSGKIRDETAVRDMVDNFAYGHGKPDADGFHGRRNLTAKQQKEQGKGGVVACVFGREGEASGGGGGGGTARLGPPNEAQNTMRSLASSIDYQKRRYEELACRTAREEAGSSGDAAYDPYAKENRSQHGVRNTLVHASAVGQSFPVAMPTTDRAPPSAREMAAMRDAVLNPPPGVGDGGFVFGMSGFK